MSNIIMSNSIAELAAEVASLRAEVQALRREFTVERINVVEPDGTLRLVIPGSSRSHGGQIEDIHLADRDGLRPAGLIFFNDEGTECGGFVFGGGEQAGTRDHSVQLSFDRFRNDQAVVISCDDLGSDWSAGFRVQDRPASSLAPMLRRLREIDKLPDGLEKDQALAELRQRAEPYPVRVILGRDTDGNAALVLHDGQQRPRIRLSVALDGTARLQFLDADGEVISSLP